MSAPLIEAAGHYPDISEEDYHENPNLLPEPSLSASGAKVLVEKSPAHFWNQSNLNPNREEVDKSHFNIGSACHHMMLLGDDWRKKYHILPEGYRSNANRKFAAAIEEAEAARESGLTIMKWADYQTVLKIIDAIKLSDASANAIKNGIAESTIAWQDKETGVWLRCRPDFLPNSAIHGGDVRVITDLKFMAPSNCSPDGFSKAIAQMGYHIAAAFYFEGIEQVFGHRPTHWLHLVVEKEAPFTISPYPLPHDDILLGHHQMRSAIRKFADCLAADKWPGYVNGPTPVGLAPWARKSIQEFGSIQQAALINAGD